MAESTDASTTYLVGTQISSLIAFPIGFIGCIIILYLELKHRQSLTKEEKQEHRLSLIWSLCIIISSIITQFCFIIFATPHICDYYANQIGGLAYFHEYIFLGLFQIQRLRKLFGDSSDNRQFMHIVNALYMGALISPMVIVGILLNAKVTDFVQYGCQWFYDSAGTLFLALGHFLYVIWDGSTLVVYVYKLSQYRKIIKQMVKTAADNSSQNMRLYQRIKTALSKVVILTLIYELFGNYTTLSAVLWREIIGQYNSVFLSIQHNFALSFSAFIPAFVVYLMQNHNKKHYEMFLAMLSKLRLTCCCNQLAHDAMDRIAATMIEWSKTLPSTPRSQTAESPPAKNVVEIE